MGDAAQGRVFGKLLDRLFASMVNGPSLNCRPHSSRQRVDLAQLAKLDDLAPEAILRALLGDDRSAKVAARVPAPRRVANLEDETDDEQLTPEGTGCSASATSI